LQPSKPNPLEQNEQVLPDIVIDTNVFVHASNPNGTQQQQGALAFLKAMHASKTSLCVDKPFHGFDEATNRSTMGFEYIKHVRGNTYSYYLLAALAAAKRILVVGDKVPVRTARKINQCIRNKHDRVFVRVAVNSQSNELASHDFEDFSAQKRKHIRKQIGIQIRTAEQALALLA
jgi:hypothetical protein